MAKLTDKQSMFIREYLVDFNATQAAIRAGYSKRTAGQIGHENLDKPDIAAAIEEAKAERIRRLEITSDNVLNELAKLGFANILDYVTLDDEGKPTIDLNAVTRDQAAAINEITVDTRFEKDGDGNIVATIDKVKFKLSDKGINLERLGRHLKLFTDKVEHSGKLDVSKLSDAELEDIAKRGSD